MHIPFQSPPLPRALHVVPVGHRGPPEEESVDAQSCTPTTVQFSSVYFPSP